MEFCKSTYVNGEVFMEQSNIIYVEPADYFPKEIREKYFGESEDE